MVPKKDVQSFGGEWTENKLDILSKYLAAYTTALSQKHYELHYIDGFAGSGTYLPRQHDNDPTFFSDEDIEPVKEYSEGSALRALNVEPPFHHYHFIEANQGRLDTLMQKTSERRQNIFYYHGDANKEIPKLLDRVNWSGSRAVMFLDPYGMSVDFETLELIAKTRAVDLWILFPSAVGINRMLTKDLGNMPLPWKEKLSRILGTEDWPDHLYKPSSGDSLFDDDPEVSTKVPLDAVVEYYLSRLKTIFGAVLQEPAVLRHESRALFHFCFAVGSKSARAQEIALRIAKHLTTSRSG